MSEGTVKFFNDSKGFGFITPDDGGKDVFVHANGLVDEIKDGDKVSYDVEEGRKGLNAVDVKVVSTILYIYFIERLVKFDKPFFCLLKS